MSASPDIFIRLSRMAEARRQIQRQLDMIDRQITRRMTVVIPQLKPQHTCYRRGKPPKPDQRRRIGRAGSRACRVTASVLRTDFPRRALVASRSTVGCRVALVRPKPCLMCAKCSHFDAAAAAVVVSCAGRCDVSPSFGLTRPMRPRFGMSNRRPSSLRSVSISRPQRPFSAFFPWSLRAHSSRSKKASPWPPSTALRPFG